MDDLVSLRYYMSEKDRQWLQDLAKNFPVELRRAMQGIGFHMRQKIQTSIRANGPAGRKWPRLSLVHRYQRLEKRLQGKDVSLKRLPGKQKDFYAGKGQYIPAAMTRWKGGTKRAEFSMQRMVGGIRYQGLASGIGVRIGALTLPMERYIRAVQSGGVLDGGQNPVKTGSQTITPAMRRLFYAAGIPLKKGRTSLSYPQRPLIRPVFEAHAQHIVNYLQLAIKNYTEKGNLSRDAMAAQAGFRNSFL